MLPAGWKEMIRACHFRLARTELMKFFEVATKEAAAQGQQVTYPQDLVTAWQVFAANPRYETAVPFIENAPMLLSYFIECGPGGRFRVYDELLGGRSEQE
jgi:hypothetical protein